MTRRRLDKFLSNLALAIQPGYFLLVESNPLGVKTATNTAGTSSPSLTGIVKGPRRRKEIWFTREFCQTEVSLLALKRIMIQEDEV